MPEPTNGTIQLAYEVTGKYRFTVTLDQLSNAERRTALGLAQSRRIKRYVTHAELKGTTLHCRATNRHGDNIEAQSARLLISEIRAAVTFRRSDLSQERKPAHDRAPARQPSRTKLRSQLRQSARTV